MTLAWASFGEDWELRDKCTFDGAQRIIQVNAGETLIELETDVYSAWKRWLLLRDNAKFPAAMDAVGGNPTVSGKRQGTTYFLLNGWRIRTWEGDHALTLVGNLYVEGGQGSPMVPTLEPHNILVSRETTNLVDTVEVAPTATEFSADQLQQLVAAVVPAVWERALTAEGAGSAQALVVAAATAAAAAASMLPSVTLMRKALTNRIEESPGNPGQLTLFDDDGTTVLERWDIRDAYGNGVTSTPGAPAKRIPRGA